MFEYNTGRSNASNSQFASGVKSWPSNKTSTKTSTKPILLRLVSQAIGCLIVSASTLSAGCSPANTASPEPVIVKGHTPEEATAQKKGAAHNSGQIAFAKIRVDGKMENGWSKAAAFPMIHQMDGSLPDSAEDLSGTVRFLWSEEGIYVFAEIIDDVLSDQFSEPLEQFWADDVLEIFFDPNGDGGIHQYNHEAFAYHIGLDGAVVDTGPDRKPVRLDQHVELARSETRRDGKTIYLWEALIKPFDSSLAPLSLQSGQHVGLMVYYCDNDGNFKRDHFLGTHPVESIDGDRNRGWIDADTFGKFILSPP